MIFMTANQAYDGIERGGPIKWSARDDAMFGKTRMTAADRATFERDRNLLHSDAGDAFDQSATSNIPQPVVTRVTLSDMPVSNNLYGRPSRAKIVKKREEALCCQRSFTYSFVHVSSCGRVDPGSTCGAGSTSGVPALLNIVAHCARPHALTQKRLVPRLDSPSVDAGRALLLLLLLLLLLRHDLSGTVAGVKAEGVVETALLPRSGKPCESTCGSTCGST
jgi:hypothetical protein